MFFVVVAGVVSVYFPRQSFGERGDGVVRGSNQTTTVSPLVPLSGTVVLFSSWLEPDLKFRFRRVFEDFVRPLFIGISIFLFASNPTPLPPFFSSWKKKKTLCHFTQRFKKSFTITGKTTTLDLKFCLSPFYLHHLFPTTVIIYLSPLWKGIWY